MFVVPNRGGLDVFARNTRFALALCAIATCLLVAPAARAAPYDELTELHERLARIESRLLDMQGAIEDQLADPGLLLIDTGGGRIEAISRTVLRDNAGMLYDWAASIGVAEWVAPLLSPENRAVLEAGIDTGLGRVEAVDRVEDVLAARQPALRASQQRVLVLIEQELSRVRALATDTLAARDALPGPEAGFQDGRVCFDGGVPMTASAVNWALYYGQGPQVPMKGNFLCTSWMGFVEVAAGQLRSFSCDMSANPPVCNLDRVDPYVEDVDPETGDRLLRTSDTSYFRILPPF